MMNSSSSEGLWRKALTARIASATRKLKSLEDRAAVLARDIAETSESLKKGVESLSAMVDHPTVFTRPLASPGPRPVYHDAERPCGRGAAVPAFKRVVMLLGEAIEKRIPRCTFCGPPAG